MLPSAVHTLEQQVERAYGQYKSRKDPMARNTFMASMKSQNEVLYYRLVERFVKEMFEVSLGCCGGSRWRDMSGEG